MSMSRVGQKMLNISQRRNTSMHINHKIKYIKNIFFLSLHCEVKAHWHTNGVAMEMSLTSVLLSGLFPPSYVSVFEEFPSSEAF